MLYCVCDNMPPTPKLAKTPIMLIPSPATPPPLYHPLPHTTSKCGSDSNPHYHITPPPILQVNVVEPHPTLPLLASSGLEHSVKIWQPTAGVECTLDIKKGNKVWS